MSNLQELMVKGIQKACIAMITNSIHTKPELTSKIDAIKKVPNYYDLIQKIATDIVPDAILKFIKDEGDDLINVSNAMPDVVLETINAECWLIAIKVIEKTYDNIMEE